MLSFNKNSHIIGVLELTELSNSEVSRFQLNSYRLSPIQLSLSCDESEARSTHLDTHACHLWKR